MEIEGTINDSFVDCLAIHIDERFWEQSDFESMDAEYKNSIEVLPGRYWRIGTRGDYPVFRQEVQDDEAAPNRKQLLLHYVETKGAEGWYIGTHLDMKKADQFAWASGAGSPFPTNLHVPYWSKKANALVVIQPQHEWAEQRMQALGELVRQVATSVPDEISDDEGDIDKGGKGGKGDKGDTQHDEDAEKADEEEVERAKRAARASARARARTKAKARAGSTRWSRWWRRSWRRIGRRPPCSRAPTPSTPPWRRLCRRRR